MKTITLIAMLTLLASCGKTVENTKFIENDYTAPEAPEFVLNSFEYDVECNWYYHLGNAKRANSVLKMGVSIESEARTFLLGLGRTFIDIEANTVFVYNPYTGEISGEIEVENADDIQLEISAENGEVSLEVEGQKIDLNLAVIPSNVNFCRNDGKFVNSIEILDRME